LRENPALQVQDPMSSSSNFINNPGEIADRRFVFVPLIRKSYLNIMIGLNILFCREPSERNEEIDVSAFNTFLEEIKTDYQNAGQTLHVTLEKFKERYNAAKLKSVPRLTSFLYDLNRSLDPMRIKSGAQIRVQVESVKRRKTGGGSTRRRLPAPTNEEKENLDPHVIPARKKRKTGKKEHSLTKNVSNNRPN